MSDTISWQSASTVTNGVGAVTISVNPEANTINRLVVTTIMFQITGTAGKTITLLDGGATVMQWVTTGTTQQFTLAGDGIYVGGQGSQLQLQAQADAGRTVTIMAITTKSVSP